MAHRAKTTIIHFGLAKTGTTYLQEYLAGNRQALLQQYGILYPSGDANHWHFQTILSDVPEALIQVRRMSVATASDASKFAKQFRANFEAELERCRPETILISSEYFSSMTDDEFPRLKRFFGEHSQAQRAVVFMRDPWSHSVSATQQNIRDGFLAAPLKLGYRKGQVQQIKRIARQFGDDMTVRPYLSGNGIRTDVVEDFGALIGIGKLPNWPIASGADNAGIGRISATILAEFNKIWPQFDKNGHYIHSVERDRLVARILALGIEDVPLRLSKRFANVIYERAEDDLHYVHRTFFGGKPTFFEHFQRQEYEEFDAGISFETIPSESVSRFAHAILRLLAPEKLPC